ncbi:MAG: histidine phosphatase family protein, partial [Candidatus Dormibacteraceae bacterium]
MSKLTRVFLIRHAEVENPRHLLYGHLPGFGLSRRGQAQAQALGRELAPRGLVRIVHSPLLRAAETAQLIAERSRSVRLAEDDRLTEAGFSRHLQGVPYWQVPFRRPLWT